MSEGHPLPQPRPSERTVRDGGIGDLDHVMAIMQSAFAPCFGERWTRSQCAGILPMAGVALRLAADDGGRTAGFSLMRVTADEAELLLIAVSADAQGQGLGSALLEDFIERAKALGAERLHLEVRDGNPAVDLYRKRGFAEVGRRKDYYRGNDGRPFDALTLMLRD